MLELDIELALIDLPKSEFLNLKAKLPKAFSLGDKYEMGWGAVIRAEGDSSTDVDEAINNFLSNLVIISEIIKKNNAVLRVGVFYETFTYTFRLSHFELLNYFSIKLEISTYPSDDQE